MKKLFCVSVIGFFVFAALGISFAQETQVDTQTNVQAVDLGNKICPVSGEKIDEKTKTTYEYQGKIYNFCCPVCIEDFKKDPEKYIQKIEEELKTQESQESKKMKLMLPEEEEMPMGMQGHEHHHH